MSRRMYPKQIPKRKSLYSSPGFRYGKDADQLANETRRATETIFDTYAQMGYNPREIAHIMQMEITTIELDCVLRCGTDRPRAVKDPEVEDDSQASDCD